MLPNLCRTKHADVFGSPKITCSCRPTRCREKFDSRKVAACKAQLMCSSAAVVCARLGGCRLGFSSLSRHGRNVQLDELARGNVAPEEPRIFLLDRDGVINVDVGAPGVVAVEQFELLPGVVSAIRQLNQAGHRVAVVTNQTAISKGYLSRQGLDEIHERMAMLLAEGGARVDEVFFAVEPHRLKPSPAMLIEALDRSNVGPDKAVMIGDKWSDLTAAAQARIRAVLVTSSSHGKAAQERLEAGELPCGQEVAIHDDLAAAVQAELSSASTRDAKDRGSAPEVEWSGPARDNPDRLVWRIASLICVLGVLLVGCVIYLRTMDKTVPTVGTKDVTSPVGWCGAAGAVLVFGSSNLLLRLRSLERVDSTRRSALFATFSGLGNALTNLLICGCLRLLRLMNEKPTIQGLAWGLMGAVDISLIQLLAFAACYRLGIAAAPSIWCGIGMASSFVWGLIIFHEPVRSVPGAAVALVTLALGIPLCASAQTELPKALVGAMRKASAPRRAHEQRSAASQQSKSTRMACREFACGLGITVCVGLLDGSLMAPYKLFMLHSEGASRGLTYAYAESFGLSLLGLTPLLLAVQAALWRQQHGALSGFAAASRACALPGALTGCFWATANICSIHASEYLGVALGFPLTQSCIIVNALWGVMLFGEMPGTAQRVACAAGIVTILAGALLLALYGRT